MARAEAVPGEAADAAAILRAAQASLDFQQRGGRRRSGAIGRRSAELRRRHAAGKLLRIALAIAAILVAATLARVVLHGIGVFGVIAAVVAVLVATGVFGTWPRLQVPDLGSLNRGDVKHTVGATQLWLEAQRPALPLAAARQLDAIGARLDTLGVQLEGIDPGMAAVGDVRRLIGEHLPTMVASYTRIPAHLRNETRGGLNADQQLCDGLTTITQEIDALSRRLAEGDLDALAIEARFLDTRYGSAGGAPDLSLPAPGKP